MTTTVAAAETVATETTTTLPQGKSWLDTSKKAGDGDKKEKDKDLWWKLQEGDNRIRIVTQEFWEYRAHAFKADITNKKDFGRKVKCSGVFEYNQSARKFTYRTGSCPCCDFEIMEESKSSQKSHFIFGTYGYKEDRYKILDIKYGVYAQIISKTKSVRDDGVVRGHPSNFDIIITKDSDQPANLFYVVNTGLYGPLSADIIQKVESKKDEAYLAKMASVPTYEEVLASMKFVRKTLEADIVALKSKGGVKADVKLEKTVTAVKAADTEFAAYGSEEETEGSAGTAAPF
jgi:predicted nucleic acid-binding Zn finger protein